MRMSRRVFRSGLVGVTAALAVAGCSSTQVDHAAGRSPKLIPQTFFEGKICADGVVRDRSGEEIRSFNARIDASWDENGVGTLDEVFYFYDEPGAEAKRETRVWTLTPAREGGREVLSAKASDVPEATTMEWAGNAIHMAYTLRYGEPGDTIDLNMDDWMFHVADGVVVNETRMTKFGIHVGQILLVMRKVSPDTKCL
ncbi:MAG: hypothetical protein CMI07_02960 [Oceanospirillaceae bacterium]|uniref:DUF3833 family protein n=2 Tax=Oceanospirillaceae TaxID=135620 RepID=UPI000C615ADF|nr:hypothetical protein [Oceanospirillaceae bacterium]|tara:strand:+ start:18006 stop:18599 length:594 start_codon:yes stop_codon:yes gene_type:complete